MKDASLFRSVLGADFGRLATALQRHYDLLPGQCIVVQGTMMSWLRFGALRLFIPFAPINSDHVQVRVLNSGVRDTQGQICYRWEREFRYPNMTQKTETLTKPAGIASAQPIVIDTFSQPPAAITLKLSIEENGRVLKQVADGPQYAVFGKTRIALPNFMQLSTTALERALSDQIIYTEVAISHPLLGRLFGYAGELTITN